jgi:glutathione S-transferase
MITLFGFVPIDRSGRVRWLLHELGVPFEDRWLSWKDGEPKSDWFRAISPLGRVPAVTLADGSSICESSAIMTALSEEHGSGSWKPSTHPAYASWMAIASSSVDSPAFDFVRPDLAKEDRPARRAQAAKVMKRSILPALNRQLAERDSILEGGLCAVDLQVAGSLHYVARGGLLAEEPRLASWLAEMAARPAAAAAGLFA